MQDHCDNCRRDRIGREAMQAWRDRDGAEAWHYQAQMREHGYALLVRDTRPNVGRDALFAERPAIFDLTYGPR